MKIIAFLFVALSLLAITACGGSTTTSPAEDTTVADTTATDTATPEEYAQSRSLPEPESWDCEIPGEMLDDNQIWVPETKSVVAITADSTTYDEDLQTPSHRILTVINSETCETIKREILPINFSADFPYYLAGINYNNNSNLVAIKGYTDFYIYDTQAQELSRPLSPDYQGERYMEDAQSGRILRLEVWEHYLVGYVEDKGAFVYDLTMPQSAKQIMPFAEYQMPNTQIYSSLFMLDSNGGEASQALVPSYDFTERTFDVNPLFEQPLALNMQVPKSALNNRYLVLRQENTERTAIVIDMETKKRIELPADIATQQTQAILDWVRGNS